MKLYPYYQQRKARLFVSKLLPYLFFVLGFALFLAAYSIAGSMDYNTEAVHQKAQTLKNSDYICCATLTPNSFINDDQEEGTYSI